MIALNTPSSFVMGLSSISSPRNSYETAEIGLFCWIFNVSRKRQDWVAVAGVSSEPYSPIYNV